MSSRDARAYLHDIIEACGMIRVLLGSSDADSYHSDLKTRLAIERELITIGEAVARLAEIEPRMCLEWPVPQRSIVGLRNLLVHGYFTVDDDRVFEIASQQVPLLQVAAQRSLDAEG